MPFVRSPLPYLALASALFAGCIFQNLSPTAALSDQVFHLNDESRWARLDLAVQRVAPAYRQTFMDIRRDWGRHIAIADTEVSALVMAEDMDSATSRVEINWYDQRSMQLRSTTLRQRWVKEESGFLLAEETVIGGDEALLVNEEEDAERELSSAR